MTRPLPRIIQGGMGVGVSSWQLARAVAQAGHLGVVSGTALDVSLARRLQDGDPTGDLRRALHAFPDLAMAQRVLDRYFRPGGRPPGTPYRPVPRPAVQSRTAADELTVVANFVEVWLAREGHDGTVGINYLEKIQVATPAAALGALLAGVDYVLMGAGIPRQIPRMLTDLAAGRPGGVDVEVDGGDPVRVEIDPRGLLAEHLPALSRPHFLAIVSATVLASYLAREESTRPDGFVIEGHRAGGHNAPPRTKDTSDDGEPVYGPRDEVDLGKVATLGLPFWLAGGYGSPTRLAEALAAGATGVQVGSLFALAEESGLRPDLKESLRRRLSSGHLDVRTRADASPTGFPFKVAAVPGTVADPEVHATRPRLCDLGYLRTPFRTADGHLGYRCAAEPVDVFVRKGGDPTATTGRVCLCNALLATVGLAQTRPDGFTEPPLLTLGSDLDSLETLAARHPEGWTATQALRFLEPA
ncbi:nitronate monooxygenase [Sporichthya brevicatena]|uniref:Nitronate monooxygenase n=1 Tax=Sporichthya brevicatena TaxID=171442 RepID=A0ABP3S7H4_9ACTN